MAEIVLLLLAFFFIWTGIHGVDVFFLTTAVAVSFWRRRKLEKRLEEMGEERLKEMSLLREELAVLREATGSARAAAKSAVSPVVAAARTPAEAEKSPAGIPGAITVEVPKPVPQAMPGPATTASARPEAPPAAAPPKPVQGPAIEPSKARPVAPPVISQPHVAAPSSPRVSPPPATPPKPVIPPLASPSPPSLNPTSAQTLRPPEVVLAAVRTTVPSTQALQAAPPRRKLWDRLPSAMTLEETLGRNWLNKLGIIILVIGVASFGSYELGQFGAAGKVVLCYLIAVGLLGLGIYLEKHEHYRLIGHTGIGGGWALLFFTTYALDHVSAMRVLGSETLDLVLMLSVAAAMVVHTLRYRSQVVTGLAFLLAYTTLTLSHDTVYSLAAGAILAIGLVAIVVRRGWFELEVFGILSSYLNHLYWLYRLLGPGGAHGHPFPAFLPSTVLLAFYWLVFRISYVVRDVRSRAQEHVSTVAGLLNALLLLAVMKFQAAHPDLAFYALLALGAAEFLIGQLRITRKHRRAFVLLSILGAVLMVTAIPFRYSGHNVAVIWLAGAELFLAAGILMKEVVFRWLGILAGLAVGAHIAIVDLPHLVDIRQAAEAPVITGGVLFALAAIVFYLNACFVGHRWSAYFPPGSFDHRTLRVHSYIGALAAGVACWSLFVRDWTAVAVAVVVLTLAVLGQRLRSADLQLHYIALACATLVRCYLVNLHSASLPYLPPYSNIRTRLVTLPVLAVAFYVTAKFAPHHDTEDQRFLRGVFALAATALMLALIGYEVPQHWQPFAVSVFALALVEAGRAVKYLVLPWHAHLASALGVLLAFTADFSPVQRWHGIRMGVLECLPVIIALYVLADRSRMARAAQQTFVRAAYTWVGSALTLWMLHQAMPSEWVAVSWIAFALLLAVADLWIGLEHLTWQANAIAAATAVRAVVMNLQLNEPLTRYLPARVVTVSIVVAGIYALARLATTVHESCRTVVRNTHLWMAAALAAGLIWYEVPTSWVGGAWLAYGIILVLIGRRWKLNHLCYQEYPLAVAAVWRILTFDYDSPARPGQFSIRLVIFALAAAGLYLMSRLSVPASLRQFHLSSYFHTFAATGLLTVLAWYEAPAGWLAAVWAVFAVVLAAVDRRLRYRELLYQVHLLALLAAVRALYFNLHLNAEWHDLSVRLLGTATVVIALYVLSRLVRMRDEWREREFHHVYSWVASALSSLLLWYELQPLSVAVGWALLGVVLFQYGLLRHTKQLRLEGYLVLVASFARIFFVNLTAGTPGHVWGPRLYTVLPIVAILFFVYAQLANNREQELDMRLHVDVLIGYLGTTTAVALLYFQFAGDWVVTAWSAAAFAMLGLALALRQRMFVEQAVLLTLGILVRGLFHNLYGSSYFDGTDWKGRFFVLGSGIAILLFSLPIAFRLRRRSEPQAPSTRRRRLLAAAVRYPEQVMFFIPVILLTVMLALKMDHGMVTVAWGVEGLLIFVMALAARERSFRLTGLAILLLCVLKIAVVDAWQLAPRDRYVTFIILGASLLLVSFLYSRYRDVIRQYL